MEILLILKKSLKIIMEEPKLFLPRVFTTALYTIFILKAAEVVVISKAGNVEQIIRGLAFLALFSIFLLALDMIIYGMYSVIAEDYHNDREISLIRALINTLKQGKVLFILGIISLVFISISMFFILIPAVLALVFNIPSLIIVSFILAILSFVIFALVFFFAIPSAVIDRLGSLEALSMSFNMGMKNRKEIIILNLFFSLLIILMLIVASITKMQGKAFALVLILFIGGRLIQAIIYTYISIATPTAFLNVRNEDNS